MTLTRTLQARTVPIDPSEAKRLLDAAGAGTRLFQRGATGIAGRGVALRIELPAGLDGAGEHAAAALGSIDLADEVGAPGTGPIAIGSLPFDATAPGLLTVPAEVVGSDGRRAWRTTIQPAIEPPRPDAPAPARAPDGFHLTSPLPHDDWRRLVADAVAEIASGSFEKVVLAREVRVETNRDIDVASVLERLRALYPACAVFSIDGFVGASPELLVRRLGRDVAAHPLAGTIPRSGDPDRDDAAARALLESAKERAEHAYVVADVAAALRPFCELLRVPEAPSVLPLRNVSHLGTLVEGRLADPLPSALELVRALHPTAAVGGTPRDAALAWVTTHEGLGRGPYAGPVGWVDRNGNGDWVVGIRSALMAGCEARLFAGVGIVADSDPDAELAETQLKLQALLAALVRP